MKVKDKIRLKDNIDISIMGFYWPGEIYTITKTDIIFDGEDAIETINKAFNKSVFKKRFFHHYFDILSKTVGFVIE